MNDFQHGTQRENVLENVSLDASFFIISRSVCWILLASEVGQKSRAFIFAVQFWASFQSHTWAAKAPISRDYGNRGSGIRPVTSWGHPTSPSNT